MEMLVGEGMCQLMDEGGTLLNSRARPFQHEKLLLVVVVESGRLLGQKVDGVLAQVEIFGDQAQHLEGKFLGADVGRLEVLLHALVQKDAKLVLVEDAIGDDTGEWEAGDFGKASLNGSDLREKGR